MRRANFLGDRRFLDLLGIILKVLRIPTLRKYQLPFGVPRSVKRLVEGACTLKHPHHSLHIGYVPLISLHIGYVPLIQYYAIVVHLNAFGTASSCPNPARLSAIDLVPTIASYVI